MISRAPSPRPSSSIRWWRFHAPRHREIPAGLTILATGPLTSPALGESLNRLIGPRNLYFYDAIAPIVAADSIDMSVAFKASRYGKGGDDYINCPMTEIQYDAFVAAVVAAEKIELHPFEKPVYFEGCMPIEEMARRGPMTLAFGPMRPVGLSEPRSGRRPFAVVQLDRTTPTAACTTWSASRPR